MHYALLVGILGWNCSFDEKKLLEHVLMQHGLARESIRSLHCTVEQRSTDVRSPLNLEGTFWKTEQGYRLRVTRSAQGIFPDFMVDATYFQGRFLQLVTRKRPTGIETLLMKLDKRPHQEFGDPWFFGLLSFIGPSSIGPFTLDELLKNKELTVDTIQREQSPDGELVGLKLNHKNGYFLLSFDARSNYLVRHAIYSVNGDKLRSVHTVERFSQAVPGVYFPEEITLKNEINGEVKETVTTRIKVISINQSLGEKALVLDVPAGTRCHDAIRNEIYAVDSNGSQIGPLLDANGKPVSVRKPEPEGSQNSIKHMPAQYDGSFAETKQESNAWWNWILMVAVVLLLLVCLLYGFRRFRLRAR